MFNDPPYKIIETKISKKVLEALPLDKTAIVDSGIPAVLILTKSLEVLSSPKFLEPKLKLTPRDI